jgi:hypothetical protein
MFTQAIWIAAIFLEGLLILRSWHTRIRSAYPLFFSYLAFVLTQDILRYLVAHSSPSIYPRIYWSTEFMGIFAGCAVVMEFAWIGLSRFPGVAKLARFALMSTFLLTVGKVLLTAMQGALGWSVLLIIQLERDMRFVQIAAILSLLLLFLRYQVPIGRNLRGIILGYGLFLGINIVNLTYLARLGGAVQLVASHIQTSAYLVALCVWTIFLWSHAAQPVTARATSESGYSEILGRTREQLARTQAEVQSSLEIR